jgi:hypothetical protein
LGALTAGEIVAAAGDLWQGKSATIRPSLQTTVMSLYSTYRLQATAASPLSDMTRGIGAEAASCAGISSHTSGKVIAHGPVD